MDLARSVHVLRLSPSQCPVYRPELTNVDREMTSDRFFNTACRALSSHNDTTWDTGLKAISVLPEVTCHTAVLTLQSLLLLCVHKDCVRCSALMLSVETSCIGSCHTVYRLHCLHTRTYAQKQLT